MTTTAIKDTLNDTQPIPVTIEKIINEVARTYNAVSYTHLDVYKRQARCEYRNPTLSSILATQMPCRSRRSGA